MKRIGYSVLVAGMISFAGCRDLQPQQTSSEPQAEASETPEKGITRRRERYLNEFDLNKDGTVDAEDGRIKVLKTYFHPGDVDSDGSLDGMEFRYMLPLRNNLAYDADFAFDNYDADNNGALDETEFIDFWRNDGHEIFRHSDY